MDAVLRLGSFFSGGTFPHAVLFTGEGRELASKTFAKAAVCGSGAPPCGECGGCRKADGGIHPDIAEFFPTGATGGYPIDVIRKIRGEAYILPNEAKRKVFILNGIDNISPVSQNALLKILEEPPPFVVFVLNCVSKAGLLPTVISRVTVFNGGICAGEHSAGALSAAEDIVKTAVLGDAITLLKKLNDLGAKKALRGETLSAVSEYLRELCAVKAGADGSAEFAGRTGEPLSQKLTLTKILKAIRAVESVRGADSRKVNMRLHLTRLSADLQEIFE